MIHRSGRGSARIRFNSKGAGPTSTCTAATTRAAWLATSIAVAAIMLDLSAQHRGAPAWIRAGMAVLALLSAGSLRSARACLGLVAKANMPALKVAVAFLALEIGVVLTRWPRYELGIEPGLRLLQGAAPSVLFVPMATEAVYRSLVCGVLLQRLPSVARICAAALLFVGAHAAVGFVTPEEVVGAFALAWLFVATRTFWIPLLVHIAASTFPWLLHASVWLLCGGMLCR
jgi:hypothetical protein